MTWRVYRCDEPTCSTIDDTNELTTSRVLQRCKFIGWRYWDAERSSVLKVMPMSFRLCPTSQGQNFFAFSDDGRFWLINCDHDEEEREEKCSELISDRAHERGRIDWVFPLSDRTVFTGSNDTSKDLLRLSSLTRKPELTQTRHHMVLVQDWEAWSPRSLDAVCDVQKVEFGSKCGILVVYRTGWLELRLLHAQ